jgi:hypothetical protein
MWWLIAIAAWIAFLWLCLPQASNQAIHVQQEPPVLPSAKAPPEKKSKGESACEAALQTLFPAHTFTKVRPEWLKSVHTGRRLELDLFNEDLKLAVEYNGRQHYEVCSRFHPCGKQSLFEQQRRDIEKRLKCAARGIKLIVVPHTVELQYISAYIAVRLKASLFCLRCGHTGHTMKTCYASSTADGVSFLSK